MLDALQQRWQKFLQDPPGERFQKRFERRCAERGDRSLLKPLYIVLGALTALSGVLFMAIPGPGIPIFMLGAALVAGESRRTARLLDRVDFRVRGWLGRG